MKMKHTLLLLLLLAVLPLRAVRPAEADSLYARKHYAEAQRLYEEMLKESPHPDIYYNIGNCCYRQNDLPRAILNYLRALRINPRHADAKHNLGLCRSKAGVTPEEPDAMFFVSWTNALLHSRNADQWGGAATVALVVALLLLSLYIFGRRVLLRKAGFFGSLVSLVCMVVCHIFAAIADAEHAEAHPAVAMKSCELRVSPAQDSRKTADILEGTTAEVVARDGKALLQLQLPNGKKGWAATADWEEVAGQ
ncbi:MAG: tetratricopeptide repeat protein [Alloprevotella sp.]